MTDNEIIEKLKHYKGHILHSLSGKLPELYVFEVIDLIKRQQAEIERLQTELESSRKHTELWAGKFYELKAKFKALTMDKEQLESDIANERMNLEHLQAEIENYSRSNRQLVNENLQMIEVIKHLKVKAIREFAERLKKSSGSCVMVDGDREVPGTKSYTILETDIDDLVKEMVGADYVS